MGFTEPCFQDTADDLIAQALRVGQPDNKQDPWMAGVTEETLNAAGGHQRLQFVSEKDGKPFLPFTDGVFPTPSGKIEFSSEALAARGLDPLPVFHPPTESRHTRHTGQTAYPLEFLPRKADNYMNSTFANLPGHQRMEAARTNQLEMHAEDAAVRGIKDGDTIEIFNSRGSLRMTVHVNGSVHPGVVAGQLNWNKLSPGGNNVNLLTSQRLTDIGGGATFYSTLVEVRKA
jgi:anaerobic selenocysteine-containing dehydrogenase